MKTPDKIKKGLECCSVPDCIDSLCEQCPYVYDGCYKQRLQIDALAYIQQLEAERDAAVRDLNNNWKCAICKRFTNPITDCPHYRECGLAYTFWEWRGVCEENGGGIG